MGSYICQVSPANNPTFYVESSPHVLHVDYISAPVLTLTGSSQRGGNVTFTCDPTMFNIAPTRYKFYQDGQIVSETTATNTVTFQAAMLTPAQFINFEPNSEEAQIRLTFMFSIMDM